MCRAYIYSTQCITTRCIEAILTVHYLNNCTVALWTLAHQTWNTHTSVLTFHNLCDSWIKEQQWIFIWIAHLVISNYSQYRLSLAAKWWFPWSCSFASHAPTGVWLEVASSHALYGLAHLCTCLRLWSSRFAWARVSLIREAGAVRNWRGTPVGIVSFTAWLCVSRVNDIKEYHTMIFEANNYTRAIATRKMIN